MRQRQVRLRKNPFLIIAFCGTRPVLKTMAFGGVLIGSMKEQEQASARGMTNVRAAKPRSPETLKKIGTSSAAQPVLLVKAALMMAKAATVMRIQGKGAEEMPEVSSPARNALPPQR